MWGSVLQDCYYQNVAGLLGALELILLELFKEEVMGSKSKSVLLDVPLHLFEQMLEGLGAKELVNLSCTCKALNRLINDDASSCWKNLCLKYGQEVAEISPTAWRQKSWKDLYRTVLHRYGYLLEGNFWIANVAPYGGLLVVVAKNQKITGFSVVFSMELAAPPTCIKTFEVCIETRQDSCYRSWLSEQDRRVHMREQFKSLIRPHGGTLAGKEGGGHFNLTCAKGCEHDIFERKTRRYQSYLDRRLGFLHTTLNMYTFHSDTDSFGRPEYLFSRLTPPGDLQSQEHPLMGWWKGSYSTHGTELLCITKEGNQLIATKLTGDNNVFAGKVSFKIDLHTTDSLERTVFSLVRGQPLASTSRSEERERRETDNLDLSFRGLGQIAGVGFQKPKWTPVTMFAFKGFEDFALRWHSLGALSMFKRVDLHQLKEACLAACDVPDVTE